MRRCWAISVSFLFACTLSPRDENMLSGSSIGEGGTTNPNDDDDDDDDNDDSTAGDTVGETDDAGDTGPKLDVGSDDTGSMIPENAEVFGHSANVLYRLDPETNEVTEVGPFQGCDASIIDIALDANSQMYATAFSSLWRIDRATAECTHIANGSYPTSLSFVPAGTVDPDEEAMVGFVDEQYVRIDTETGAVTPIATLSDGLASSGDLVSVKDGGSYLTVFGPGCEVADCIIEIDPSDGTILQNYGLLPYDQVFGLAFWAGRAYGFARDGILFEIQFNGADVDTTVIQIPGAPSDLEFFGAGSTTSAPPAEG